MDTSAEFSGKFGIEGDHTDPIPIFLPEKHHSPGLASFFQWNRSIFLQENITGNFLIDNSFYFIQLGIAHLLVVAKIKSKVGVADEGTLLLNMLTQYTPQCGME